MDFLTILTILIFASFLWPVIRNRLAIMKRLSVIKKIETDRRSRVITANRFNFTYSGWAISCFEQIANALKRHKGNVTVIIPFYAMSGGTLIAVAADEIIMNKDAVLGSLDPIITSSNKRYCLFAFARTPKYGKSFSNC